MSPELWKQKFYSYRCHQYLLGPWCPDTAHLILWLSLCQSKKMMRQRTPKPPRLRLQLLLYTNMGAEALGPYFTTTRLPPVNGDSKVKDNDPPSKHAMQIRMYDWIEDTQPQGPCRTQDSSVESGDEEETEEEVDEEWCMRSSVW